MTIYNLLGGSGNGWMCFADEEGVLNLMPDLNSNCNVMMGSCGRVKQKLRPEQSEWAVARHREWGCNSFNLHHLIVLSHPIKHRAQWRNLWNHIILHPCMMQQSYSQAQRIRGWIHTKGLLYTRLICYLQRNFATRVHAMMLVSCAMILLVPCGLFSSEMAGLCNQHQHLSCDMLGHLCVTLFLRMNNEQQASREHQW